MYLILSYTKRCKSENRTVALNFTIFSNIFSNSTKIKDITKTILGARGGVVVNALHYKPASRGFDSRWCHWNFSLT